MRAVVFDIGNVLFRWNPRFLYEKLIDDPDQLDWFLNNVVTTEWHFQHDAGRSLADMVPELTAQFPACEALIASYVPRWLETIPGPVSGSLQIVRDLAARNIPLFAITNFGAELWALFRPTQPVLALFADVVVSGVEKMIKPQPAIYQLALRRFGLAKSEALFIDDRLENVRGAAAEGFVGYHFTDAAHLRTELERLALL